MSRQIGLVLLFLLSGCSTLAYYGQAAQGQASLLLKRQSVPAVLKSSKTSPVLRARLETSQTILRFAREHLHLPDHGRYRSLVMTRQRAVVWNVVATPELSLAPLIWCYPIIGCLPYRGYFREAGALRMATRLRSAGNVVSIGGVPAYSTLGWFRDPLLDTFIHWSDGDLANLLFHELTHGRVWVNGDAAFNESLASFVGYAGVLQWLSVRPADLDRYVNDQAAEARFAHLLDGLRMRLESVYTSTTEDGVKQRQSDTLFADFRLCHAARRDRSGNDRYDAIVANRLNNAYLAAVQTYAEFEPAFVALFRQVGSRWPEFWSAVDRLAAMPPAERRGSLRDLVSGSNQSSGQHHITHQTDHNDANEVECQPFLSHTAGGKGTG
jgi:predicted aminopeptidase